MPYARMDDRYDDHRKIKRAWRREPAAVALHAMAITYANRHTTDGLIDAEWVEEKLALLPYKSPRRAAVLTVLLELKLFEQVDDDHFLIHDFLDWNLSRQRREALAEQGRRGGQAKANATAHDATVASPSVGNGFSQGQSQGHSQGLSEGSSTPLHAIEPLHQQQHTSALDAGVRDAR